MDLELWLILGGALLFVFVTLHDGVEEPEGEEGNRSDL